ncbi:hypothetical protein G7046_g954 [Stylonectria norvegica]|nr:hypothetical protein G7046_g954 [Stylonectria norvegica]
MATITVNGNTIDPEDISNVSEDAQESNFIYIQGHEDLKVTEKQDLEALHAEFLEYVAEYTYLCRYNREDLERIRALPFVRAANIYHPELKSTISLKQLVEDEDHRTEYEVDVILHDHPNVTPTTLAPFVAEKAGVEIDDLEICSNKIRLTVHQDRLDDVASLDSVNRIEEVRAKGVYNNHARDILWTDTLNTASKYTGDGQIICVADTGFDQGHTEDDKVHPAFVGGRVQDLKSFWLPGDAKDPVGHGTHVCGSICGSGIYSAPSDQGEAVPVHVKGTAPDARLVVQAMSVWDKKTNAWGFKAPAELQRLFAEPYDAGLRIHNNSWGDVWVPSVGQLDYNADATAIDKFIHEHQDFVVLIAAGNDAKAVNHQKSQIGDNGAAKNCITVGATGTTRPNDFEKYDPSCSPPASGITETAIFSSRGPTKSSKNSQGEKVPGRIKPDVVAPGVAILSAASRSVSDGQRIIIRRRQGECKDRDWFFMSGTSMATPLVAGCVALMREAFSKKHGKEHPSAALIKALLVNGAVNYSSPDGPGFDYQQGFGRVDIDKSIAMIENGTFVDGGNQLETSNWDAPLLRQTPDTDRQWESQKIPLRGERRRLVVTLAYSDPPHGLLQNDVNLIVQAGGEERHGNMGSDQGFDHTNNVEKIIWDDVPGETAIIVVRVAGFTKTDSEQSFAVAWFAEALP